MYCVTQHWDQTPPELQRLDREISVSYVMSAMEAMFGQATDWEAFAANYSVDMDDFLTPHYHRWVREKFDVQEKGETNLSGSL